MIPFLRKIFIPKKSNNQFEKIQNMEMKKKELEDKLNYLQGIEEELKKMKKNN